MIVVGIRLRRFRRFLSKGFLRSDYVLKQRVDKIRGRAIWWLRRMLLLGSRRLLDLLSLWTRELLALRWGSGSPREDLVNGWRSIVHEALRAKWKDLGGGGR